MDCSGPKAEELVHKTDFACHVGLRQNTMAPAYHAHDFEALNGYIGCSHPLKAAGRSDYALERAVICFDDIVQVLRGPMLDIVRQQPFAL
jgi:hypothetical protein